MYYNNKITFVFFVLIFVLPLILGIDLRAQERIHIASLQDDIVFDGRMDEKAWAEIEMLPLITLKPKYGAEPSQYTEIKLAYDESYLYVGGILMDDQPDKWKIQFKRDDWKYNCDWFGIIIDNFNDKENTVTFATSPSGGRTDVAFSNDATNIMQDMNLSWNTYWDVKTQTDSEGWYAEMRIPFSSLRFQEKNDEVVMGVTLWRYISNLNETYVFPELDNKYTFWGTFKASQTNEVVFTGIKSKNPVYIAPYVLGGFEQKYQLNESETAYEKSGKYKWNIGGDVKYRLSDNLTMDLSVNTDFAQVEADDQQVNLTRFSLFFPEKRLFFQERRSNFEFNFDNYNRLFYTRRIGIESGNPVDIYGGGRLVGRAGPWDIGFLSMQTAPEEDLGSENFSVMRLRRQVINQSTYVGGILTNRIDFKGKYNTAYGIDGIFNLFGDDYLKLMWAQTFTEENTNKALSLDPSRVYMNWERRTSKGLGYNLIYSRAGKDYEPGIGYERRSDYSKYSLNVLYGWIPEKKWLYSHNFDLTAFQYMRNDNNSRESGEIWFGWSSSTEDNAGLDLTQRFINDNLTEDFYLSDDEFVPAGSYTFSNLKAEVYSPRGKKLSLNSSINIGPFYDGWINSISLSPRITILNKVELQATYQYNTASFNDRDMFYKSHLVRLNGIMVFNTKLSVAAFVQYNSSIDAILANARLRYNPKEGVDFYIVYNEGYNTDRYRDFPSLPVVSARTVMLKYTHTIVL